MLTHFCGIVLAVPALVLIDMAANAADTIPVTPPPARPLEAANHDEAAPLAADYGEPRVVVAAPDNSRHAHLSWPKVVRCESGTLVLAYSAGVGHNQGGSGPAVSLSHDDGQTFTSPNVLRYYPDDDDRYRDCGNLALGIADDGAVVLLAMAYRGNVGNTIVGWRSTNDGKTWKAIDTSNLADNKTGSVYGHVLQVPGKGLVVFGHYRQPGQPSSGIWMATSTDDGRGWKPARTVTTGNHVEPAVTFTQGRFVGLLRLKGAGRHYDLVISDDLGESWRVSPSKIAIPEELPGRQPSPFITVSTTDPNQLYALQSIRGQLGDTGGRVYLWTADLQELDWKKAGQVVSIPAAASELGDWSYPWMTPLDKATWFLAFYCGKGKGANSIHGMTLQPEQPVQQNSRHTGQGG